MSAFFDHLVDPDSGITDDVRPCKPWGIDRAMRDAITALSAAQGVQCVLQAAEIASDIQANSDESQGGKLPPVVIVQLHQAMEILIASAFGSVQVVCSIAKRRNGQGES